MTDRFAKILMGSAAAMALATVGAIVWSSFNSAAISELKREAETLSNMARAEALRADSLMAKNKQLEEEADTLRLERERLGHERGQIIEKIKASGPTAIKNPDDLVPLPVGIDLLTYDLVQTQAKEIDTLTKETRTLRLQVSVLTESSERFKRAYNLETEAHGRTRIALKKAEQNGFLWKVGSFGIGVGLGYGGGRIHR